MQKWPLLTLLENRDVAGLVAFGEQKTLESLIDILESYEKGQEVSGDGLWQLGRMLAEARFFTVDRELLSWAVRTPTKERFDFLVRLLYDLWGRYPLRSRIDRERLDMLLKLRSQFPHLPQTEEMYLRTLASLIKQEAKQPADTQELAADTLTSIPAQGFASPDEEETYLVHCAPLLRGRGVELPTNYPSFFSAFLQPKTEQ